MIRKAVADFIAGFRKGWRRGRLPYPPHVYICSHNGVTGVVSAAAYEREVAEMRAQFDLGRKFLPDRPLRPQVYPVFLFSNRAPSARSFRVGGIYELWQVLEGCFVEERAFELPPLNAPGHTPYGYCGSYEEVGRENTRHRKWTLADAWTYLQGGTITTYNV